jgi:hypothetical protein
MRRLLSLLAALAVVLSGCAEADRGLGQPSDAATASAAPAAVWPLRGTKAPDDDSPRKRPIVVKVAADPSARPQSGLADADLVLEIPVEGGITRYAVVFHSKDPGKVGPVRSARQSDLNYLSSLHAIVAHVGASEQVTKLVRDAAKGGAFVDVDEFEHADAFERTSDRPAPYNAYTTAAKLRQVGGNDKVTVPALQFGEAAATALDGATLTVPTADPITYAYDAGKGAYHRAYNGGAKTTDGSTEVLPENVVVILTDVTEIPGTADSAGAPSVDYRSTGSGKVVILRDGKRYEGTWAREGNAMYAFKDAGGVAIPLKPGLTWLHILPADKM